MFDSHAHIISDDCALYPPVSPRDDRIEAILAKAFTAEKLLAAMNVARVKKALVVQRTQIYGFDNSYVCTAAQVSDGRLAAVCGIDAKAENCGEIAREWHARNASGFRLMARPNDPGFDWLSGANAEGVWKAACDLDVPMCVHFFGKNRAQGLEHLFDLLGRFPVSNLIVDHLTNPAIESETEVGIDDLSKRLSDFDNVTLKFTSIPLNMLKERKISASAILAQYLALFGEDRLIWGSDITQSAGSYGEMVANGLEAVADLIPSVQQKLLQENTARIYQF